MPLILRTSISVPLTWAELDGNFSYLDTIKINKSILADNQALIRLPAGDPSGITIPANHVLGRLSGNIVAIPITSFGGAPLDSPAFTGIPTAPTPALGTDTTQLATTAFVQDAIDALLDGAPGALNTLNELAAAINDDASFAATIVSALAAKAPLASPAFTGNPTGPTQAPGDNSTKLATTAYTDAAVAAGGAPATMLKISAALDTTLRRISDNAPTNSPLYLATNKVAIDSDLSIGKNTAPGAKVDVKGNGATSGTYSMIVANSSSTEYFKVRDDGRVDFGGAFADGVGNVSAYTFCSKNGPSKLSLDGGGFQIYPDDGLLHGSFGTGGLFYADTSGGFAAINSKAILDLVSTTRGVLLPRLTTTQKTTIAGVPEGLILFDLTLHKLCVYNGSAWETITSA